MTLNFYQVNCSSSLLKSTLFNHSQNLQYLTALNLGHSSFVLFPYIRLKSPYRTPPSSVPMLPKHVRQQDIYSDLDKLNAQQVTVFLYSYQTFKHSVLAKKNLTNITNPFYQWVIKHKLSAWELKSLIIDVDDKVNVCEATPIWCQARMGQSKTLLPDGRIILIAGEYEDYYDPDFCIYNDVIVINLNGDIEGHLPDDKLELLQQNLRHKLSKIESMACEVIEI